MTALNDKHAQVHHLVGAPLGPPRTTRGGGQRLDCERGCVIWHPTTGARELHGAIYLNWREVGQEAGPLGYPTTDENPLPDGGAWQSFMDGQIYWRSDTGAHGIWGTIFERFAVSWYLAGTGLPTGELSPGPNGGLVQGFEQSTLTWSPGLGASVVPHLPSRQVVVRIFPITFPDIPMPAGLDRDFLHDLYFAQGKTFSNPAGERLRESLAEQLARMTNGRVTLSGSVDEWFTSGRNCWEVPHWAGNDFPDGEAGFNEVWVELFRARGIRSAADLRVDGRMPDVICFLHTDLWAGGGAARTWGDAVAKLREAGLDQTADAFDEPDLMRVDTLSVSLTHQVPRPEVVEATSRFPGPPPPGSIEYFAQSAHLHELVHIVLGVEHDIYTAEWGFRDSNFEIMSGTTPRGCYESD